MKVFDTVTPIDTYLAEQAGLTAVQEFSRSHVPGHQGVYRDLIELDRPGPGQQYAFEVDLDACTGCKACVTACSSLNGLDSGESWRTVGLLHGGPSPQMQTVTTACHHCLDPACLNGCPVNAYEKDSVTGIVRHLDDQCIGCGYCVFTCPYEVPLYNEQRGIVRKCDMCSGRLEAGEPPACVQACPNEAIRITLVDTRAVPEAGSLVPGAPPSSLTRPSTVYRTTRNLNDSEPADRYALKPAHPHPPLAAMLVLTQLSVGAFAVQAIMEWFAPKLLAPVRGYGAAVALATGLLALGSSVFHLGRPRYAYRAILGIGHSWLSREIAAFGAFAALAFAYAASTWTVPALSRALSVAVTVAGMAGVACSTMVYAVTSRAWWRLRITGPKFALTSVVSGLALMLLITGGRPLIAALMAASGAKLALDASVFAARGELRRTAVLLSRDLASSTWARFVLGLAGGVVIPALALTPLLSHGGAAFGAAGAALAAVVAGELVERTQFFRACASPSMPGALT